MLSYPLGLLSTFKLSLIHIFCFNVCGIDYSENGCIHSKRILEQQGIAGEIVLGDFFNPPKEMYKKFDVVVSFGVVEHFQETAECLKALRKYLKPGGIIITVIPNMAGLIGTLQRILNKKIYDIPVSYTHLYITCGHFLINVFSCALPVAFTWFWL